MGSEMCIRDRLMVTHDDHAAATAGRQLTLVGGKLIESGRETVAAVAAVAGVGETSASRDPS